MTSNIASHLQANTNIKKRDILVSNFLGGLSWGFGSVIGATIVVAILLKVIGVIPGIGSLTNELVHPSASQTR